MPGIYRQLVWYLRGRSQYTKAGFASASRNFLPSDLDVDLSEKHFMITGANSGLGKHCATEFARRGGTVHMVCRNESRGLDAKNSIIEETSSEVVNPFVCGSGEYLSLPNNKIHLHIVDMANTRAVAEFARQFIAEGHPLDVLVNNAGCMLHKRVLTDDGFESNFAVNTLGPYVLTSLLLPLLKKSSDPRVINVSSGGMLLHKLNASDPQLEKSSFNGVDAYSQQKVILSRAWANNNPWLKSFSMHPGWADTPAVQEALPDFYERMKGNLRSTEEGADTVVWLAIAESIRREDNGKFFQDRRPVSEHLPLALTSSSAADIRVFLSYMETAAAPFLEG